MWENPPLEASDSPIVFAACGGKVAGSSAELRTGIERRAGIIEKHGDCGNPTSLALSSGFFDYSAARPSDPPKHLIKRLGQSPGAVAIRRFIN